MKPLTTVLLTASLLGNAALAYAALSGSQRVAEEAAASVAAAEAAKQAAARPAGPPPVDPQTWAGLETADLTALAGRLREAGFPKDVIRAIVSGQLYEQFAARRRALDPNAANRPFWKDYTMDPKVQLALNRLYYEQEKALRAILGPDARPSDPLTLARQRARFGSLPPEKLEAARVLAEELEIKQAEQSLADGIMTSADYNQRQRELRTALASLLSPAELEEYDLRNSNTGQSMRRELASFNATEEEFRAIYKLRQPFDEKYSYENGLPSQAAMNERATAQKQLTSDIQALLSPERAAEYERAIDFNYQRTAQLVARLELPPETATTLFNTQKEFEKRRSEIYRTNGSDAAARNQQLATLQQEAIAQVTQVLGSASRVEAYKPYGGQWITNMIPRPRPTQ